ncbi:hypothetical protein C4B60_20550 [Jeotgalibacillus proteolyticus]|uniref:Uncharacterized protein n=1 Tax=Jeotgalibacillus proteolyticus TaxID=2082395 RepID=A0A2S5G6G6_9BACL|nr:hypothetical protein C4B60_20550 [Jeotgalibacillus proteolyticus]
MTGLVAVVLGLSIPITAIITMHFQRLTQMKKSIVQDELELEKLRHENFLLETEKLKVELAHRQLPLLEQKDKISY